MCTDHIQLLRWSPNQLCVNSASTFINIPNTNYTNCCSEMNEISFHKGESVHKTRPLIKDKSQGHHSVLLYFQHPHQVLVKSSLSYVFFIKNWVRKMTIPCSNDLQVTRSLPQQSVPQKPVFMNFRSLSKKALYSCSWLQKTKGWG